VRSVPDGRGLPPAGASGRTNGGLSRREAARLAHRAAGDERPVTELVGDIVQNLNALARAEARLAVAEVTNNVSARAKRAGRGAGIAAAGGVLGLLAGGALVAAAAAALSLVVATWLAILIVGVATGLAAALAISRGVRHLRLALTPSDAAPRGAGEQS
jgi:hypothetical protein